MANEIGFKSYCWAVGTTSYRTNNFNLNIECQLALMDEFWSLDENKDVSWKGNDNVQKRYYNFLKQKEFVKGEATRPDKDAREKTSGLVDIGLLTRDRKLTEVGRSLLEISNSGDFTSNNPLEIPKDSFVYFKQLLKTSNKIEQETVRPFIVFLYLINKTEYLTKDEFTYLLPLCISRQVTDKIVNEILSSRQGNANYEQIIVKVLSGMTNYREALEYLQTQEITEELFCTIGMNRKSAKYDKPYFLLYNVLKEIVIDKKTRAIELYEAIENFSNRKVSGAWKKHLYKSQNRSVIKKKGNEIFNDVEIMRSNTIREYNENFFQLMHLFKAKATLEDYFDLNRRYFKVTDVVIFEDEIVKLDILPKCYIANVGERIGNLAFVPCEVLEKDIGLSEIDESLYLDKKELYETLGKTIGTEVNSAESAKMIVNDEKYARFNKLIDSRFSRPVLVKLFDFFEARNDEEIRRIVTDNADIPTIFEYILGISWYFISNRKGNVLEYMNLSLDANLLPKTHAGGGEADLVWKYDKTDNYQAHTLLLEATLADGNNQRRMEMEPVSRHLGDYLLSHPDSVAYCVFVTTHLHINVISDFRGRKKLEYYSSDTEECIDEMKILPLQTSELKTFLNLNIKYDEIFSMFAKAYDASDSPKDWYEKNIIKEIELVEKYRT